MIVCKILLLRLRDQKETAKGKLASRQNENLNELMRRGLIKGSAEAVVH
jgi:hypothetical protein